jgi:hypothetical protein
MANFLRISFFKTTKPRKFEPLTRYYDPDKERINDLMKHHSDGDKAVVERIKYKVKNGFVGNSSSKLFDNTYSRKVKQSNMRLVVILIAIIVLLYLIFNY